MLGFTSCGNKKERVRNEITVSILPYKYFAEQLTGGKIKVNCMLTPGDNPSTYQPSPQQIGVLEKSALYFKNGHLVFEDVWVRNMEDNNPMMRMVDCSKSIQLLEGHHHEDHAGHEGDLEHTRCDGAGDPHYWVLPQNALQIAKNMFEALKETTMIEADSLEANYAVLVEELTDLSTEFDERILNCSKKGFLIYHPALSYVAEHYQLLQLPIEQEGKVPSVSQLKDVLEYAISENIQTIFIQKQFDKDNATLVAQEINGEIVVIDPLGYNYPMMTRDLMNKLHTALNE